MFTNCDQLPLNNYLYNMPSEISNCMMTFLIRNEVNSYRIDTQINWVAGFLMYPLNSQQMP